MRLEIQAVGQMYGKTLEKRTGKYERTDIQERYKELYVKMAETLVSRNIGH